MYKPEWRRYYEDWTRSNVTIDDIGVFNTNWEQHIVVLGDVLQRLEQNGFTINPLKCEWGVNEANWLGILTDANWPQTMD